MNEQITEDMNGFWHSVMERLNTDDDLYAPIPALLKDTCDFFDFGCGFVYQANYASTFFLRESYILYQHNHLPNPIDIKRAVGEEYFHTLGKQRFLLYSQKRPYNPCESAFGELFKSGSLVLVPITDESKSIIAVVGMADRRTTSRKRGRNLHFVYNILSTLANHVKLHIYENRVAQIHHSLINLIDNMGVDLYVNDFYTHEILFANQSMSIPYGGAQNLVGRPCWQVLVPGQAAQCTQCPQPSLIDEVGNPANAVAWEHRRALDGRWMHSISAAFPWIDGRLAHVVSSVDVTEIKDNEETIRRLAEYDVLTGLLNRRRLLADIERDIKQMEEGNTQGFLLFIDLDGFKQINDTLGHQAGDVLLCHVAGLLQSHPLSQNHCYRNGGDEFVVLLRQCDATKAYEYLAYLAAAMGNPVSIGGHPTTCSASIGVAHYPGDGHSPEQLMLYADTAMYNCKQHGGGHTRFYNGGNICLPDAFLAQSNTL